MQSTSRPGETVREMLDYVVWIAQDLMLLGAYSGSDVAPWRRQVGVAYRALVNPMVPGFGDPYPPDVPAPRSPGLWPDVAAHDMPGMTVRHQLAVIGMLADKSRHGVGVRVRPELLADLEMRIARARTALDHGPARPLPAAARTLPSTDLIALAEAEEKAVRERARKRARRDRSGAARPGSKAKPPSAKPPGKASPSQAPKVKAPKVKAPKVKAPKVKAAPAPRVRPPAKGKRP